MIKTGNYIGVMSGTSLDGVDVVVAEISDDYINQRVSYRHPMPETLKKSILSVCQGQCVTLAQLGELDLKLGVLFADAVEAMINNYQLRPKDILAIGCHGQTVWHQPMGEYPFTMQIGDNNQIVARTNIATIGDFRRRDMAYGGQGAPLVPLFHQAFLSAKNERRIVLNVGGMANVSFLFPGCPVQGFDTGPGNMLLDAWIYKNRNLPYDENGLWAKQGRVNYALLELMLSDGYFAELPPKSSGRERFNLQWLENILLKCTEKKVEDIQATLVELTAVTISDQIRLSGGCHRLLVCGGGAHNRLLMDRLKQLLPETKVSPTDDFGIGCDDMEALAFAWLAARTLSGLSGNLPSVTGASQDSVLGAIFPINLQ